ncbi:MAG TPA: hypothetical protein VEX68_30215 [Bryobacteraceae bacterium]|nr:hypothetical protein [Bryobacteraceae bacterium]
MPHTEYRGRRAVSLENGNIRLTALVEGGHIAEILHKPTGVNPLWTPPWPSVEPSVYSPQKHPQDGTDAEAKLLAGIMGHNLCVDLFGGPSAEEAAAGVTVHGEASVNPYQATFNGDSLIMRVSLPSSQLMVERTLSLDGQSVKIIESVENTGRLDRPIAWTQHVTLGPPFLDPGKTRFSLTAVRSRTYDGDFGDLYPPAAEFLWPHAPARKGGTIDLSVYPTFAQSAGFTTHLMDPQKDHASFAAYSPTSGVLIGYRWRREDFPWCGIWEENRARKPSPWNAQTVTRGFEFGVSPMPETRRQMIDRGSLFGVPGFRWIPAKTKVTVRYEARIAQSNSGDLSALFG